MVHHVLFRQVLYAVVLILPILLGGCPPRPFKPSLPVPPAPPRTARQSLEMAVNTEPVLNFNRVAPIRDPSTSTFAVMDFGSPMSPEGQQGAAGVSAADTFYISLSQRNVKIIERERIKKIAAEQDLIRESKVLSDQEKAQRIGRLAGADYIIFGAVTEYKSEIRDVTLGAFIPDNEKQRYAADYASYQRASAEYQEAMAKYLKDVQDYNRQQALIGILPLIPAPRMVPEVGVYFPGMAPTGPAQIKGLEQWEDETGMRGIRGQLATVASIGLTSRVIDVPTGQIVWVGQGAKRHLQLQEGMQILINKLVETMLMQPEGSTPPKKP